MSSEETIVTEPGAALLVWAYLDAALMCVLSSESSETSAGGACCAPAEAASVAATANSTARRTGMWHFMYEGRRRDAMTNFVA